MKNVRRPVCSMANIFVMETKNECPAVNDDDLTSRDAAQVGHDRQTLCDHLRCGQFDRD